ncbi:MAG: class I SAM-dependent methyltransferase [Anaerolineae bacterium]|nr:class I SAM-dependent methyltransferase [Anaerolineae bacterium]
MRLREASDIEAAKTYDCIIEPLVRGIRATGMKLVSLRDDASVLDVGCGTGSHLNIYQKAGYKVFGIDLSPGMLNVAQKKLAGQAGFCLGDVAHMPFLDRSFDLVQAVFVLHTLPDAARSPVLAEVRRVVKREGRFLVIDYHVGSSRFLIGWLWKAATVLIENVADREHTRNYRSFMANGGLPPLLAQNGLHIDQISFVGGGTIGLYLLARSE